MENYIIESLNNLGYTGPETELPRLELLLAEEPDSTVALSKLVHFLSEKLCSVSDIEERVNVINSPDEIEMMCMELSGLLRELYCPYSALMEGPHRKRLSSRSNRLKLLNFLATECEAAAMISTDERQKKMAKTIDESPTAKNLKSTLMTLGFSKPPSDLSAQQLFKKTNEKVQQILKQQSSAFLEEPLLKLALTENQWCKLRELHAELSRDYKLRREMLLTRLDVTFLSFTWSANLKTKLDQVSAIYQPLRSKLTSEPHVRISHILSARESLGFIQKTSSAAVREKTQTPLQKLVIGKVPDRGGRPSEYTAPMSEMPGWQKRNPDVGRGGSRGGFRGGHRGSGGFRGGRVQGGWNQGGSSWNQEQRRGRGGRN